MNYRFEKSPVNLKFEIAKILVSSGLLVGCFFLFDAAEDSAIGLSFFAIVCLLFLIHGIHEVLDRKNELPFCEIDSDWVVWRPHKKSPISKFKVSEIDVIIYGNGTLCLGKNEDRILVELPTACVGDPRSAAETIRESNPNIIIKTWEPDED